MKYAPYAYKSSKTSRAILIPFLNASYAALATRDIAETASFASDTAQPILARSKNSFAATAPR